MTSTPEVHTASPISARGVTEITTVLTVNGEQRSVVADTRVTLLDALRDHLALTGTKKGCDQGACGACTVHADGRRVLSCLTLVAQCEGREVTTIEGLSRDGQLHPMQEASSAASAPPGRSCRRWPCWTKAARGQTRTSASS
jgi:xanthine dehydrogenase YagT iron-sulfur-binding subunit